MVSLQWSTSQAVFVAEIDDEHKEIFEAVTQVHDLLTSRSPLSELRKAATRLTSRIAGHFAHEERLMAAARYCSIRWHKQAHHAARRRVKQFVVRIEEGDSQAGVELVEYLTSWLNDHTGVADRMMGAFLRNHRRCMKLTFRAGTKPMNACPWVDSSGDAFDPGN
jgi:hemerythrin